jgi:hypothetical protein
LCVPRQLAVLQGRQPRRANLNWADRALPATLPGLVPKARRQGLRLPVTPDTILRWHRDIVRHRRAVRSVRGKTGPATSRNIRALVLRLARENPGWGYRRDDAAAGRRCTRSGVRSGVREVAAAGDAARRTLETDRRFLLEQSEFVVLDDDPDAEQREPVRRRDPPRCGQVRPRALHPLTTCPPGRTTRSRDSPSGHRSPAPGALTAIPASLPQPA